MITRREILRRLALGGLVSPLLLRRVRAAYLFAAGSSQYLETSSAPLSGYPVSFGGWVWLSSKASTGVIACLGTNGSNKRHQIYYLHTSSRFYAESVDAAGSTGGNVGTTDPSTGAWYHVIGVFISAANRELWVNGVREMVNTTSITGATGQDRILIGARRNSSNVGAFWNGSLGELGFWNVALGAPDIQQLFRLRIPRRVRPNALKSYASLVRENVAQIGPAFTAYNAPGVAAHPRIYR